MSTFSDWSTGTDPLRMNPADPRRMTGVGAYRTQPAMGAQFSSMTPLGQNPDPFNMYNRPFYDIDPMTGMRAPGFGAGLAPGAMGLYGYSLPEDDVVGATGSQAPDSSRLPGLTPTQAVIGAAPGVLGGLYGGFRAKKLRDSVEFEDLTPESLYTTAADAFRREQSALTPNYAQSVDAIDRGVGDVIKTAERTGTSAGTVINAAIAGENNANNAKFDLMQAGADRQSRNRARADQVREDLGKWQALSEDREKSQRAAYDRAMNDNFFNAFQSAASFALMGV